MKVKFTDKTDTWLADNEICSEEGFVYAVEKPKAENLAQLKVIKDIRKANKLEQPEENSGEELVKNIISLTKLRSNNRAEKLRVIAEQFLGIVKTTNRELFERKELNSYIWEAHLKVRTEKQIAKDILSLLKKAGFQAVVGITADAVNSFSAFYFWGQIEKIIRELRRKRICFTVKKKGAFFVANDMSDIDYFEKVCERAKDGMDATVEWGREWVEQEQWKNLENYSEPEPKPKQPATIDDRINNAKTKIVKLWKGEK